MKMRTPKFFIALLFALAACSSAADPRALNEAGELALRAGNRAEAGAHFADALALIDGDTTSNQFARATWGSIEANATVMPERAKDDFLALAERYAGTMRPEDYAKVASWLMDANQIGLAFHVVNAGIRSHSESALLLSLIERIKSIAAEADEEKLENWISD